MTTTTSQQEEAYPRKQRGATRQSRRSASPLLLLKRLMDASDDPHKDGERVSILAEFRTTMHSDEGKDYLDGMIDYWFANNYKTLLWDFLPSEDESSYSNRRQKAKEASEQRAAAIAKKVDQAIEERAIKLLDLLLPNGKTLRECTGRECKQMSKKVGEWLLKVSSRVKPDQLVGDALQEVDVRKLYGGK